MKKIITNGLYLDSSQPADSYTWEELSAILQAQAAFEKTEALKERFLGLKTSQERYAHDLTRMRWGVIWYPESKQTGPEKLHRQHLQKLLKHRKAQSGYKIPELNYEKGWTAFEFVLQNGGSPTVLNTAAIPYYLLIVAPPERIPWSFQQQLDAEYAVGRLWFDEPEDCKRYVDHLIAYETGTPQNAREILVAGSRHAGDKSTQATAEHLAKPVYHWLTADEEKRGFRASLLLDGSSAPKATRQALIHRLKGEETPTPAILFTATHGLATTSLPESCGALVMQDYPGGHVKVELSHCLAGDASLEGLPIQGLVAFCYACYSAGVPRYQDWVHPSTGTPQQLAPNPYVSRLPQKLLANGALAFIGHISKAWGFSFLGVTNNQPEISLFSETLGSLMDGKPAGHALSCINRRTLELNGYVSDMYERPQKYTNQEKMITWMSRNDSRGYVLLGDPYAKIKSGELPG